MGICRFIIHQPVLIHPDMTSLIMDLFKNCFQVIIISTRLTTKELKQQLDATLQDSPYLQLLSREDSHNLQQLYLKATVNCAESRYLTVVFDQQPTIQLAKQLDFYCIEINHEPIANILTKLHVIAIHQLQYLPALQKIKYFTRHKMGYPTSLLQYLRGDFTKTGVKLNSKANKLMGKSLIDFGNFNYYINNLGGDPFIASENYVGHTRLYERDIVNMLGKYYGLPEGEAKGFVTSGGTEGNFSGIWWARDRLMNKAGVKAAFYFSTASHYSLQKIAEQLSLELHPIPSTPTEEINLIALKNAVKQHMKKNPQIPIIINVNAGTIRTGAIDDLPTIKNILETEVGEQGGHYVIHLDAACIGAVIPLLKPFGNHIHNYFAELGISTISFSAYKFFGVNSICGIILTTQKFLDERLRTLIEETPYVASQINDITPSGSRSGNNVLQIHNLLYSLDLHTDQNRLKKIIKQCRKNCQYFYDNMLELFPKEKILWQKNSFSISFPKPSAALIRKYSLMPLPNNRVGIYALVNVDKKLINLFIKDFKRELEKA